MRLADAGCVPCKVAITFVIGVGCGIRGPAGWMNVSFSTVIRPSEAAASCCSSSYTQLVAAPIPRFGSVCDESVCLCPEPDERMDRLLDPIGADVVQDLASVSGDRRPGPVPAVRRPS